MCLFFIKIKSQILFNNKMFIEINRQSPCLYLNKKTLSLSLFHRTIKSAHHIFDNNFK